MSVFLHFPYYPTTVTKKECHGLYSTMTVKSSEVRGSSTVDKSVSNINRATVI